MIPAISSVRQNVARTNAISQKKSNQVAFTGMPVNLLKNEGKVLRFADEAKSTVGKMFKKLLGKAELPFSKKPLTADATLKHILPDGTAINVHLPDVHVNSTKVLDGSNMLVPDAADSMDALTTKAALADVISGTTDASDALTSGVKLLASKADIIDAAHTGIGLMASKTDAAAAGHAIIDAITEFLDKIL